MTTLAHSIAPTLTPARSSDRGEPSRWKMLRLRTAAARTRLLRWEFWPSWAIYLPLIPYILFLAARYRGLRTCTHANPGIPHGGIVGESKWDILQLLPKQTIAPTALIARGPIPARLAHIGEIVARNRWAWPIILKPDVGERGHGVKAVATLADARDYLEAHPEPVLAQELHPGPFEAGVFYYRFPNLPRGRIFSITDKRFALVVGDGRSTLRTLIWRHPRYRVQAQAFLIALGARADSIPGPGVPVPIGSIGNHCRGAMFLDGARLITPELETAFDAIARRTEGFYFGRFDVRYADPAEFALGRGFTIIELNGLLSESTSIYDPSTTFWSAQKTLRAQWRIAFAIGHEVRQRSRVHRLARPPATTRA